MEKEGESGLFRLFPQLKSSGGIRASGEKRVDDSGELGFKRSTLQWTVAVLGRL